VAAGLVTCVLTPEQTEGPFYVAGEKVRRNITEGRPGTPLTLRLKVVNASNCKAIKNAAVDIWHTDALGVYSGVQGSSGTFMRGNPANRRQTGSRSSRRSIPVGTTAEPCTSTSRCTSPATSSTRGSSTSRTPSPTACTPTRRTRAVPGRDTRNAADSIYRNGGSKFGARAAPQGGAGYVASLTMGVYTLLI
jgi:hypothetical protein